MFLFLCRRTFVEVLADFPSARPPLDYLFDLIPPIMPRAFSISSAQALNHSIIQVTAAIVQYRTPNKRDKVYDDLR